MAAISASRSWARRAITTATIAGVGLLALAIPASAHVPAAKAGCDKKAEKVEQAAWVRVDATAYLPKKDDATPNSVKVIEVVKGKETVVDEVKFGVDFHKTWNFDGTEAHTFKVSIVAWDDQKFSKDFDLKTEACIKKETTPAPQPPPANPPANNPPAPQPAPAPAVGASGELASTGVSIAIPLAIGALLLAGGGALLLMMRRRSKA